MRLDLKRRLVAALLLATTGATTAMAAGSGVDTMGDPNFYTSYRLITYTAGFGQFDINSHDEAVNGETFVYTSIGQLWNGQVANQNAVVTNNGATYWTNSMGPTLTSTPAPDTPVGSITSVLVEQSFVKTSADAQLSFTYTGGLLQLYRDVEARPPCVAGCAYADVAWRVEVVINSAPELELMHETGRAAMAIQDDTFKLFVSQSALDGTPVNPLWNWGCTRCGTSPAYGLAAATLDAPYTGIVDLSSIPFDPAFPPIEFTVRFWLDTTTNINEPYVGATAWAKDPLSFGDSAGVGLTLQGLLPTNNAISAVPEPAAWLLLVLGVPVLLRRRQLTQGDRT